MPGGSPEPFDIEEEDQCVHCGRWYRQAGVLSHEQHCEYDEAEVRMHALIAPRARVRAGETGPVKVKTEGREAE